MSIFQKDCPQCAASHAVYALRCPCGYCFDPEQMEGTVQMLELVAQEEQLYLDYLSARLEQARNAARAAVTDLSTARSDRYFTDQAAAAMETLRSVEAELAAQTQKVDETLQAVASALAREPQMPIGRTVRPAQPSRPGEPPLRPVSGRPVEASPSRTPPTVTAGAPVNGHGPGAGFRMLQAETAARALEQARADAPRHCPRCTARVVLAAAHCPLCRFPLSANQTRAPAGHSATGAFAGRRPADLLKQA